MFVYFLSLYSKENAMQRSFARALISSLLIMLSLLLAACGGATSVTSSSNNTGSSNGVVATGPIKILVDPKAVGSNYWEVVHGGATCAAGKLKDVTIQWDGVTSETDVTGQINKIQNYITQGVNGIVYAATDAKALVQVTNSALKSKISVANFDSGTDPQPSNVPLFATDNKASAVKAADLLSTALNGQGDIGFLPFQAGSSTSDQRAAGFTQGLAAHPGLHLVATQYSHSDANTALQVTEDMLSAHPSIKGIFAANEPGVIGAAQAVKKAGLSGKVVIIGWDAAPDEVAGVQSGEISDLVVQNPFKMGYDGLNAVVKEVRTGNPVATEDTGVTFVSKANINDPKVQAVLNPTCASFTD
jgi:ribose transport system substrate-binding protein